MTESKEAQVEQVEGFKRWTAKRKSAVVLDLIKGKTIAVDVARKHDLTAADVEGWVEQLLAAALFWRCRHGLHGGCQRLPAVARQLGLSEDRAA
ncbi:MAG: hypothetical protein ACYS15_17515 [Planctomycetota bacterium]|jgi:transposase-like protein